MLSQEQAALLLDVGVEELSVFDTPDQFNPGNTLAGYLCKRSDRRYGALVIHRVNSVDVQPQIVYGTPKLQYPFDRVVTDDNQRHYRFPKKVKKLAVYIKLDGSNVLAYVYYDAQEVPYVTYKTRLTPVIKGNTFGDYDLMWREMLQKDELQTIISWLKQDKTKAFSFELYGSRNPLLIAYDTPLDTKLLFVVNQDDAKVEPPMAYTPVKDSSVALQPECIMECPEDLVNFYEAKRVEAEAQNTVVEETDDIKRVQGIEGYVFYVLDEDDHWTLWKAKPPSVENIAWTACDSIPMSVIMPTAWNACESCDVLTAEYVAELLKEEFDHMMVNRVMIRIEKAVTHVQGILDFRQKVRTVYAGLGLPVDAERKVIMQGMSKHFAKGDMRRVGKAMKDQGLLK